MVMNLRLQTLNKQHPQRKQAFHVFMMTTGKTTGSGNTDMIFP